ncbi:MAG: hypothetical protein AB1546_14535, partial [bacterium]
RVRKWLRDDLVKSGPAERDVVLFTHHPVFKAEWIDEGGNRLGVFDAASRRWFLGVLNRYGVNYMFSAHISEDSEVKGAGGVRFITTGREMKSFHKPRYRLIEVEKGEIKGIHYQNAPNAISFGKVKMTTLHPNDWTSVSNRVVITNGLTRDLYGLKAVAKMARLNTGDYIVRGADKIRKYVTSDSCLIFLDFDLKSMGKKVITIRKK